jgi:UDP-glucose 4-epimerase
MNVYGKTKYLPVDERHPTEPVNLYGLTKLIGEELCEYYARNFAYRVIILRYSGVFGTGKNVGAIASFVSKALRGESLCLEGDGSDIWDTLSFKDVIHANILALKNIDAIKFGLFNIGYGKGLKVKKVAEDIINFTSSLSEIKFKEKNDKIKFYYNIRKAREKLKFNPLPFHQRLKEFIKCSAT